MTRQIMAKMFHNNLLAQFSYVGQKKKKIFSILNSCTIIFGKNKIYIIFNINLNIIIHLHGKQNNIPISYTYFFNVSASVRSVQAHRNCTDLEILKPMKFFMANAKFREEKKNQNNSISSN